MTKDHLRQDLAKRRAALVPDVRERAQLLVNQALQEMAVALGVHRVAVYLAIDDELKLDTFIKWLHTQGCAVYAPRVDPIQTGRMEFVRFDSATLLVRGRFQLLEPHADSGDTIDSRQLDMVCVPMLGFDGCIRIGWGKGYYDRAFAFRQRTPSPPHLVGVAFACQAYQGLQLQPWDVPMDSVVSA